MKHGFVRVKAAAIKTSVADCGHNMAEILREMKAAEVDGVKLIVFPELCITGYTCGDLFFQETLLRSAKEYLRRLIAESAELDMAAVVGLPYSVGQKIFNCAAVISRGRLLGLVPKINLPNYSEYYERRQFTPAPEEVRETDFFGEKVPFGTKLIFSCEGEESFTFAVEICEDLWVPESPSVKHAAAGAMIIANPSAGDETVGKADYRRLLVKAASGKLACGYVYSGAGEGESTGDMVFSGHCIVAENGSILEQSGLFTGTGAVSDVDVDRLAQERRKITTMPGLCDEGYRRISFEIKNESERFTRKIAPRPFIPEDSGRRREVCGTILDMQAAGLRKRIEHTRCRTCVVGISGGLDSALALLVTVRALDSLNRPRTDALAITMPCFGTTSRTKSNAQLLCEALGVSFREVDITQTVKMHFSDIGQSESDLDVTFENSQARERTQVLMDIANKTGGIVIGTGDLSELALGWATYNGDHMSMYGVNASVPKTLVRYLVAHCAETTESGGVRRALEDILATPVSPELLPAENGEISQKTEDLVGPYELHDFFLYYILRFGFSPSKVYFMAKRAFSEVYDDETIKKWLTTFIRRFFAQQFKRSCLPDGPKIGTAALSPRGDWRMPSDASSKLWLAELEAL